jgi:hypothetical protein
MAKLINATQVQLNDGTIKTAKQGEWYDSQHFFNGSLGSAGVVNDPGAVGYNQRVSNEVVAATNPNNVSYINSQIEAQNVKQAPTVSLFSGGAVASQVGGLQSAVDTARANLEATLGAKKTSVDAELQVLKDKEKAAVDSIGALSTPFRADLEEKERERLYINKNFEDNQALVNELDSLLTQGNELIKQQSEVTGISAIRNPRIQKTMNDVAARAGVIQAVMSARNDQIAQAETMIDRTVGAINADRKDEISYYETILELNNRDIVSLDSESKKLAEEQLNLVKGDLERAQATQDYVKQLMIDPASASLMAEAGVTLNDSVETINAKMGQAQYAREVRETSNELSLSGAVAVSDPSKVPADRLITITDSKGVTRYYQKPADKTGAATKEGSVASKIQSAAQQDMKFDDFVVTYANVLDLADIYEAYSQSPRGKQFGPPQESPREIALLYKVARGEISATEAEKELGR